LVEHVRDASLVKTVSLAAAKESSQVDGKYGLS